MHLKFPKQRNFWTWDELGCLSRALGFQEDLFARNVTANEKEISPEGLKTKQINDMIDSKALSPDLHRTFNMHDAAYNMKVIQKSMDCLSNHYLNFQQINDARLAFQLYEHMDHAGLVISEHILERTLKICGRAISSLKLMQFIKHMDRLVPDRLMFYEFLDIVLISEKLPKDVNSRNEVEPEQRIKDERGLYKVCNFEDILLTEDKKTAEKLNEIYQKDTDKIPVKKSKNKVDNMKSKPWLTPSTVDHKARELMVNKNKYQAEILRTQLDLSNNQVLTRSNVPSCDCIQPEPENAYLQAEDVLGNSEQKDNGDRATKGESSMTAHDCQESNASINDTKVERIKKPENNVLDILVTSEDVSATSVAIEELQWKIATQGERMRQIREMNPIKSRNFRKFSREIAEADEKPSKADDLEEKTKARNMHSLADLIRNESPELARRLESRQNHGFPLRNNVTNFTEEEKDMNQLHTKRIENDNGKLICLDERLRRIDLKLDRVYQR